MPTRPLPTVIEKLELHLRDCAGSILYEFLHRGEEPAETLTFAGLDAAARRIAAGLEDAARPGDRAILLYPPGLAFAGALFGCFRARVIAVPVLVPGPNEPPDRLARVAADCQATVVLTVREVAEALKPAMAAVPALAALRWIVTDALPEAAGWDGPPPGPDDIAFLQYTSGSTGDPKGVVLRHANLAANEEIIRQAFGHGADTVVVGWLPMHHDMGLIGNLLQPLWIGRPCIMMSPMAFLQRPVRWLRAISTYRGTTSGGPNFAYEACLRRIPDAALEGLDLSSWSLAFNGSETVRPATLDRFARRFAPYGFRPEAHYPCYGMAEVTLFATGGARSAAPVSRADVAGCGRGWADTAVAIVDPESRRGCADGTEGEIWIRGGSVADGYWNRPELSRATFAARRADAPGRWLRTGDLGVREAGELFVTGRLKDMVIVRGRNAHAEDLERTAEAADPALRPHAGAAFAVVRDEEERLVIVHDVERTALRGLDAARVAEAITEALTETHGIRPDAVLLVPPGTVPRTSSGKIRRSACRDLYLAGAIAPLGAEVPA